MLASLIPTQFPRDWYWLAQDGRLYSSAQQDIITVGDESYADWLALGLTPTPWPRDAAGEQTDEALIEVIGRYGLALSAKAALIAYAAAKRYAVETGGITVNGSAIDTTRESQSMITGAYAYSQAHPEEAIVFKAASGWVSIDAATMAAIATAVGAHVQSCFAAEGEVSAQIEAGSIASFAEIDAYAWPSS